MGFLEILVVAVVVLLFFGARKLPGIGEGLGKAVKGFRDAVRPEPPPGPPPGPRKLPPGEERRE
jgi:sec-independent protein translocase protein TatA